MSAEPSLKETAPRDCREGVELVHRAQDDGNWRPVVEWLAQNPEDAGEIAREMKLAELMNRAMAPTASCSNLAGATLGGYELHEIIGEGGAGVVFRAFDPVLKRPLAVKVVRSAVATADDRARFQFEAKTVASLDHPNIVPILTFAEEGAVPYLVMPLMTGGTLEKYRKAHKGGRLPAEDAARLVRDIARGVHHAHQRGLIHRDLKPLNVLLDADGAPRVADFGLAREIAVTAHTEGIAGTFAYMAPEQARGDKGLTIAVDIHALGATLFELLTGKLPFGGGASALQRVIADAPPPVRQFAPDVSKDLEAVCLKCLEKLSANRYTTALEVAEELDRFIRGEPVKARPPGFWDWVRQLARTRPDANIDYAWPVTAWFGVIILVVNASIYALVRYDQPAAGIWLANVVCSVAMALVLWWYMLRRFRQLPVTERHSLIIAAGHILAYFPMMAAFVPLSLSAPARDGLGIYPPMAALSGLGLFTLGSTNWSRFFPVGLGVMCLVPVLTRWPEESPLVFGAVIALVMWYWAYVKDGQFGQKRTEVAE